MSKIPSKINLYVGLSFRNDPGLEAEIFPDHILKNYGIETNEITYNAFNTFYDDLENFTFDLVSEPINLEQYVLDKQINTLTSIRIGKEYNPIQILSSLNSKISIVNDGQVSTYISNPSYENQPTYDEIAIYLDSIGLYVHSKSLIEGNDELLIGFSRSP